MIRPLLSAALALTLAAATTIAVAPAAGAATGRYRNCTALQRYYPHGVGLATARDRTSGRPVTTFKRSTPIYRAAMRANRGLDRDRDGIACERR